MFCYGLWSVRDLLGLGLGLIPCLRKKSTVACLSDMQHNLFFPMRSCYVLATNIIFTFIILFRVLSRMFKTIHGHGHLKATTACCEAQD